MSRSLMPQPPEQPPRLSVVTFEAPSITEFSKRVVNRDTIQSCAPANRPRVVLGRQRSGGRVRSRTPVLRLVLPLEDALEECRFWRGWL